jgi:DNA-binding MarR family transcriptional regulator
MHRNAIDYKSATIRPSSINQVTMPVRSITTRSRRRLSPVPAMGKAGYEALAEFRYTLRRFLAYSEGAAKRAHLTPQQYQAMMIIKGYPGRDRVTLTELSRWLLIRPHTAVELVDRLARLGLVKRAVDKSDRRRVLVCLSAKGERKLKGLAVAHLHELRRIGVALPGVLKRLGMG